MYFLDSSGGGAILAVEQWPVLIRERKNSDSKVLIPMTGTSTTMSWMNLTMFRLFLEWSVILFRLTTKPCT